MDSGSGPQVLANDARMASCDAKKRECWSLRGTSALFPVSQGVNTDAHGASKLKLGEAHKLAKRSDVLSGFEFSLDEASSKLRGNGAGKIGFGEFRDVSHECP